MSSDKRNSSAPRDRAQGGRLPPLHMAVRQGDIPAIQRILKEHPDSVKSTVGEFKSTALHVACRRGATEVATLLIDAGAEINLADSSGKTALHWACSGEHVATVRYLLSLAETSTTVVDLKKRLPLHLAIALGTKDIVDLLIKANHKSSVLNAKDVHGSTPLHVAVRYSREDAETLLLAQKDIDVDAADRRGRTALHYASQLGHDSSVKRLIAAGATVLTRDSAGDTPLHYACHAGSSVVVHLLIAAGADVNAPNNKTMTPMHIAVEIENDTICHILTQSGADIGIRYDTRFYQKRHQKHVRQARRRTIMLDGGLDFTDSSEGKAKSKKQNRSSVIDNSDGDVPAPSSSSAADAPNPELESLSLKTDRYGYIVKEGSKREPDEDIPDPTVDPKGAKSLKKTTLERTKKWVKMLRKWEVVSKKKKDKVTRRVWKGIPDPVRGQAWRCFMQTSIQRQQHQGEYADLSKKQAAQKVVHQIDLDINRSARDHIQFYERFGPGQISLFNVLKAYSIYDPVVSYCQSMSDITAFILMQMEEEEAFWFLVQFLQNPKFKMARRYEDGFPGLRESFYVHTQLMKKYLPELAAQFEKDQLDPAFYTMNWFMKIFIDIVPTGLLLRMWDLMLFLGFDIVYSFIIVIIQYYQDKLLGKSMDECMMFLQRIRNLPAGVTPDQFIHDVKALGIKPSLIRELEAAYQKQAPPASSTSTKQLRPASDPRRKETIAPEEKVPERTTKKPLPKDEVSDIDASAASDDFAMGATFNPLNMELPPPVEPKSSEENKLPKRKSQHAGDPSDHKSKRKSVAPSTSATELHQNNGDQKPDDKKEKRKSRIVAENGIELDATAQRKSDRRKSRIVENS